MKDIASTCTGFFPWITACLLHKGGEQYNQLTDAREQVLFSDLKDRVFEIDTGAGANLSYYLMKFL